VKDGPGPTQIGTVSRGTNPLQFIDPDYIVTAGYTDNLLYYDARAFYSLESTTADPQYVAVFAKEWTRLVQGEGQEKENTLEVPLGLQASNYPNPFNPTTTIRFSLPDQAQVSLEIFNTLGEKVRTLIHSETYQRGYYNVAWDGKDSNAKTAPSGMYFYRIVAGQNVKTVKMLLMK
jgi:hypothetical protein